MTTIRDIRIELEILANMFIQVNKVAGNNKELAHFTKEGASYFKSLVNRAREAEQATSASDDSMDALAYALSSTSLKKSDLFDPKMWAKVVAMRNRRLEGADGQKKRADQYERMADQLSEMAFKMKSIQWKSYGEKMQSIMRERTLQEAAEMLRGVSVTCNPSEKDTQHGGRELNLHLTFSSSLEA